MNKEFFEALEALAEEKGVSKESLIEGIRQALLRACLDVYQTTENIIIDMDEEKKTFRIFRELEVVDEISEDKKDLQILLSEAQLYDTKCRVGDFIRIELEPEKFSRNAAQNGKSIILQKIREEERLTEAQFFKSHENEIITGTVIRTPSTDKVSVSFGKADAMLYRGDIIPGEIFKAGQHIKVYVAGFEDRNRDRDDRGRQDDRNRGQRVKLSRSHPEFVRKLFEQEVVEIQQGIVEIKAVAREAGNRSKIAVMSHDEKVDPVGACIGLNRTRLNAVTDELYGEKIDIILWDENPAILVENALSPAKVIAVAADEDTRSALVVVPDDKLSLAIGLKGQNSRLAHHLTGYHIDIKSESQAREEGLFDEYSEEDLEEAEETEE